MTSRFSLKDNNVKTTVIIFTFISLVAKIIAFARELLLSYFFGAGTVSDVFILSMTIPVTIFGFVATGITSGFIPMYQKAKINSGKQRALFFTNNVINVLLVFCLLITALYFVFPKPILMMFAKGFDDTTIETAQVFTNYSIFAIFLTSIITVLTGYLQINDNIKITALVSVPLNLGIIIAIIISHYLNNIYILPAGFLISSFIQFLFIVILCIRNGFKYSIKLNLKDEYLRLFIANAGMLILSGSLQQINQLIDRTLASTVSVGGLSLLEYGNKINDFAMGMTIIPISSAIFPLMTKSKDNNDELGKSLIEGINISSLIIIPVSVLIIVFSEVIVKIIYYRGAFSAEDVLQTSGIVMAYGIGLIAFSLRSIFLNCFYATGDVKKPMINSSIGIVCNIILNFILLKLCGLKGLALATSISAVITVILLYIPLKKRLAKLNTMSILFRIVMLYIISVVLGVGALFVYNILFSIWGSLYISFGLAFVIFAILYLVITMLLGLQKDISKLSHHTNV